MSHSSPGVGLATTVPILFLKYCNPKGPAHYPSASISQKSSRGRSSSNRSRSRDPGSGRWDGLALNQKPWLCSRLAQPFRQDFHFLFHYSSITPIYNPMILRWFPLSFPLSLYNPCIFTDSPGVRQAPLRQGSFVAHTLANHSRQRYVKGLYWEPQTGNAKNIVGIE